MSAQRFLPISQAPRDGTPVIVADDEDGGWQARAYWSDNFWALHLPPGVTLVQQIDFEPTRFRRLGDLQ